MAVTACWPSAVTVTLAPSLMSMEVASFWRIIVSSTSSTWRPDRGLSVGIVLPLLPLLLLLPAGAAEPGAPLSATLSPSLTCFAVREEEGTKELRPASLLPSLLLFLSCLPAPLLPLTASPDGLTAGPSATSALSSSSACMSLICCSSTWPGAVCMTLRRGERS